MSAALPNVIKTASGLLDAIEQAVSAFPRKYRYLLGQDIRRGALNCSLHAQRAMMKRGQAHHSALLELEACNDELKLLLQSAHRQQCFRSAGEFETVAERAYSVGRQTGALIRAAKHPHGQNAGAFAPPAATRDTEYPRRLTEANV